MLQRMVTVGGNNAKISEGSGTVNTKVELGFRPKHLVVYGYFASNVTSVLVYDIDFEACTCYSTYKNTLRTPDPTAITSYFTVDDTGFTLTNTNFTSGFGYAAVG